MKRIQKTGRRASQQERDNARDILELYRAVMACPDGNYCVNPEDDPEIRKYLQQDDVVEYVISCLENFVEHGTFEFLTFNLRDLQIREGYIRKTKSGMSRKDAIEALAEKFHLDNRTIERIIVNVKS
jgi:hypothetical protein